jgi:hypothetical protein
MVDETRVVVLPEPPTGMSRMSGGIERRRALGALAEAGIKVRHDSGGRLLIVDASEETMSGLRDRVPDVDVVPLDEVVDQVGALDAQDALFLQALRLRMSADYQSVKSELTPGETPEEQLLRTAPCTPPEG